MQIGSVQFGVSRRQVQQKVVTQTVNQCVRMENSIEKNLEKV